MHKVELCRSSGAAMLPCLNLPGVTSANSGVQHVADADGDGRPDAYLRDAICQIAVSVLDPGNADQYSYSCNSWTAAPNPGPVFRADFNGDGRIDTASYVEQTSTAGHWDVHLAGHGGFPDLLSSVTNGFGHVTQFDYKGLHDSTVYTKGSAATYPTVDVNGSGPVVSQMRASNALGGWLVTDYRYEGNRVDVNGRGALGFEYVRTIDRVNDITTTTRASQTFPFIGMALEVEARQGNGAVLSLTESTPSDFATTAGARYAYVSGSTTNRRDLDGTHISTLDSTIPPGGIDAFGNVTSSTETITTTTGVAETFATTTNSTYINQTSNWLIGLLASRTTTKTATQAGTVTPPAPGPALTLSGCSTVTPTTSPAVASMTCTLGNGGPAAATSITYAGPAGTAINSGPASCAANTANCGAVTLSTGSTPGTYSGTLTATPIPAGNAGSASVNLVVNASAPSLTLTGCSSATPTTSPTAASMTCTLGNSGQTAASSIAYSAPAGTTTSGPSACAASTSNCGTVTVTTSTAAASYTGTLTAMPTPAGNAASAAVNLTVNPAPTAPALTLTSCSSTTPTTTPTAATMTCTLGNSGQTAATAIAYSAPAGTTPSGPASCAANTANCGSVTVTTGTAPGTYSGTLTANPTPSGSAASAAVNLTVNGTPAALGLNNCGGGTSTAPTPAQHTCTLRNNGGTSASSVTYSTTIVGASVSGPGSCAAGSTNCGTVTVQSASTPGTSSGTFTATPNAGSGVTSAQIIFTVNPATTTTTITASPTSLAFGTVSKGALSPIKTVTVSNTGTLAATLTWPLAYTGGTVARGGYSTSGLIGATCVSGGSLAAGASCVIAIRFIAGCEAGSRNGQIDIQGSNFTTVPVTLTASTSSSGVCN